MYSAWLGFPWFLRGVINEASNDDICDDTFPVQKCGIEVSVSMLFGTLQCFPCSCLVQVADEQPAWHHIPDSVPILHLYTLLRSFRQVILSLILEVAQNPSA